MKEPKITNATREQVTSGALLQGDKVLWIIIAMLSIISVLLVFSATAKMAYDISGGSSTTRFLLTQLGYLGGSIAIMLVFYKVRVRVFGRWSWTIWGFFLLLTLATLVFGSKTNGAARWFSIGFINIQPSEFLKVATVLHLSRMLSRVKVPIAKLKLLPPLKGSTKAKNRKILLEGTLPIVFPIFASVGAILIAHTSSAILVFIISILILLIAGVNKREVGKLLLVAIMAGGIYTLAGIGRSDTAGGRVETWIATWLEDRTQVQVYDISDTERSMVAIQNGGLLGQGAGQSAMRVEMIHPETDYAFAFFVEEYGLILSIFLLLLYLWVFFRAMWIYERCEDRFSELLVINLALLILVQALLHVMVSVNFLPETGQILPLISRGGSALFCTYMSFMLMLSISRRNEEVAKAKTTN